MILVDISQPRSSPSLLPRLPYKVSGRVTLNEIDPYWSNIFGARDEVDRGVDKIHEFIKGLDNSYKSVKSLEDCYAEPATFFFDFNTQHLTVHFVHTESQYTDTYKVARIKGFCDKHKISLDGIDYDPIITSTPNFSQKQDFAEYDKLTFINGSITFNNNEGRLDNFFQEAWGNHVIIRWLNDVPGERVYYDKITHITKRGLRKTTDGKLRVIEESQETTTSEIVERPRITEDGRVRVTEDGKPRVVNEEVFETVTEHTYRVVETIQAVQKADIIQLATLWVDSVEYSLTEVKIKVQDLRKKALLKTPFELFNPDKKVGGDTPYARIDDKYKNKAIPLMYGKCAVTPAIPIDSKLPEDRDKENDDTRKPYPVTYCQAVILEELGTVELLHDDGWWTPVEHGDNGIVEYDTTKGQFTIVGAVQVKREEDDEDDTVKWKSVARKENGRGAARECRVRNSTGIPVDNAADIITHMRRYFFGVPFNASNYDVEEWEREKEWLVPMEEDTTEAEEVVAVETNADTATTGEPVTPAEPEMEKRKLEPIGVWWDKRINVYEAIRQLQQSTTSGFRYEITPEGLGTIRANRFDREVSHIVNYEDILNNDKLKITTDNKNLAAVVNVGWGKDFAEDTYSNVQDKSNEQSVSAQYRQSPEKTFNTLLGTKEHALQRAAYEAQRLGKIRGIVSLELMGFKFFNVRILDVIQVELTPKHSPADVIKTPRKYWGTWKAQVLSVSPDEKRIINKITAVLIKEVNNGE